MNEHSINQFNQFAGFCLADIFPQFQDAVFINGVFINNIVFLKFNQFNHSRILI